MFVIFHRFYTGVYFRSCNEPEKLLDRLETMIRDCIERSTVGDLQPGVIEARVPQHDGPLSVVKPDRCSIHKRVIDKLGAVGLLDCQTFYASDDGVLPENIVAGPPRPPYFWIIGPKVKKRVVPEKEGEVSTSESE